MFKQQALTIQLTSLFLLLVNGVLAYEYVLCPEHTKAETYADLAYNDNKI
jgi:hypothetical protein